MSEEEEAPGTETAALVVREESDDVGELYSSTACWKARSFRLAVLVSVVALVVTVLVVVGLATGLAVASSKRSSQSSERVITLDDVFNPDFQVLAFQGTWAGTGVFYLESGAVKLYDPATNVKTTVVAKEELESLGTLSTVLPSPQYFSGEEQEMQLLLSFNRTPVYRHSALSDYYLYTVQDKSIVPLMKPDGMESNRFQYVSWSPNAQYIAYVLDYDIYVLAKSSTSLTVITSGGSEMGVVNGIPDWVYEEEVFSSDHALWWSPDSQQILFATFDDSQVERYSFPKYGDPSQQYDTLVTIPYPKPGTVNPEVRLYVVTIADPTSNTSLQPGGLLDNEHYLAYAGWADTMRPYAGWLNRTQTYIEFCSYYSNSSGDCELVFSYEIPGGWVEQYSSSAVRMVAESSGELSLYTLLSRPGDGDDAFTHLALVRDSNVKFLTGLNGRWDVKDIVSIHDNEIFYVSSEEGMWKQHLYSYNTETETSACLSCDQQGWGIPSSPNPSLPGECSYFQASCDEGLQFCLLQCRGPCVPYSIMTGYSRESRSLTPINILEPNSKLRGVVTDVVLPTTETFTVAASEEGPELLGRMTLPPGFDSGTRYPVLMYVYGGPNIQLISDSCILNSLSNLFYVSNLSLILASVDGRGTGGQGDSYKFAVYKNLGHLETVDQNRAGKHLGMSAYVDEGKLAIYGSSYGGYMAGNVGSSGSGVFKAAISQSPVSDWHYYDSIYTERYMLKPGDNQDGYQTSSVLPRASNLRDVDFLLIHGTGDDNVHYQHTAQLAEALTQDDVQFRMQVYTDKAHSLTGGNTRRHLYQLIADFLSESFKT